MHKNATHWPPGLPPDMAIPETSIGYNLEVAATRYPGRTAIAYYGSEIRYDRLLDEVERLADHLQHACGVAKGDRVLLYMQNCPQFVIATYAILRIGGVVVPVNTMNLVQEVRHVAVDSSAKVALFSQELAPNMMPLLGHGIEHAVVACYRDYLAPDTDLPVPDAVSQAPIAVDGATPWTDALSGSMPVRPVDVAPDDLAFLVYTSGTTGAPKGCMHTHRSVLASAIGCREYCRLPKDQIALCALPMFHVTGLQTGVNAVIHDGSTMVVMTRWDRQCAAMLIERYRVTSWTAIPTMLFDFLAQPGLAERDLSSITLLSGGGAAMPKAVAERIQALWGIPYVEGYGLSETMATTHTNPVHRPKAQCLGIPVQNTDAVVVDPDTLAILPPGKVGEILIRGPQVFRGYWQHPEATAAAFVDIEGERFFRTGDLGYVDDEGYFFIVDRLKRMINASGYKVWPAEVESLMFAHPAIQEACVIGIRDPQRGEGVKLVAVLAEGQSTTEAEVIAWARAHMAAYKAPQVVEFVDRLPKSGTGKVQWRELQARERARE
ncbi:AMP-binding protein [Lysobacter sp. SG-8]|uniref:AMP-binding protein n=1 Tax=Marilutibacter penaei TaxID=2759900 RepID=A0A7W3U139_9GAMM|nr:long-chain-fatty-acid--CoA ligase [Lysobacter penaei]MBB1087021.1 AMP-binding protein [Lysobacter penaei]